MIIHVFIFWHDAFTVIIFASFIFWFNQEILPIRYVITKKKDFFLIFFYFNQRKKRIVFFVK